MVRPRLVRSVALPKLETAGRIFHMREDESAPRVGRGCIGYRERRARMLSSQAAEPGRDLSQRVVEFALPKPGCGQERKSQPYRCPKAER
jgi:hypothetical protein